MIKKQISAELFSKTRMKVKTKYCKNCKLVYKNHNFDRKYSKYWIFHNGISWQYLLMLYLLSIMIT